MPVSDEEEEEKEEEEEDEDEEERAVASVEWSRVEWCGCFLHLLRFLLTVGECEMDDEPVQG